MVEAFSEKGPQRDYEEVGIDVVFPRSTPISDPEGHYPGFKPGTRVYSTNR